MTPNLATVPCVHTADPCNKVGLIYSAGATLRSSAGLCPRISTRIAEKNGKNATASNPAVNPPVASGTVAKLGVRWPPRRPRTAPRLRPRFPPASKPKPRIHPRSENERGNTRPPSHPQSRDGLRRTRLPRLRNCRLGTAAQRRRLPHHLDVHHRARSHQNGPRLPRPCQSVIIPVQRY